MIKINISRNSNIFSLCLNRESHAPFRDHSFRPTCGAEIKPNVDLNYLKRANDY